MTVQITANETSMFASENGDKRGKLNGLQEHCRWYVWSLKIS